MCICGSISKIGQSSIRERAGFLGLKELFLACCQWLSCNTFTHWHFGCHHCIPWPWKCGFWCTICHTFDILDHLIMCYCVDVGHFGKWRRVRSHALPAMLSSSFVTPHTPMIDFRQADKCWYSAAGTLLFWGPPLQHYKRSATTICRRCWGGSRREYRWRLQHPSWWRQRLLFISGICCSRHFALLSAGQSILRDSSSTHGDIGRQ